MAPTHGTNVAHARSRRAALLLGGIASIAGTVAFVASALTMVCLWVALLFETMGWLGVVLGVSTSPLAAAYPFLHWAARGEFPLLYFAVWSTGIVGMTASMAWAVYGRQRLARRRTAAPAAGARAANVVELPAPEGAAD
jgi:hypothetical protein